MSSRSQRWSLGLKVTLGREEAPPATHDWVIALRLALAAIAIVVVGLALIVAFIDQPWGPIIGGLFVLFGSALGLAAGYKMLRTVKAIQTSR